jgi:hypothetical protein
MRSGIVVPNQTAGAQQYTNLRHDARGGSNLLAHQQLGAIALPTNPTNAQTLTLTINGNAIVITFVSAIGSTAGNVLIAGSAAATAANLLGLLNQPQTTTSTAVALSTANQQFVGYLSWPLSGTTITPCANNTTLYAPLTSFTVSTTVTGGSWTAQTMQLYVEPGVVYVNGTRVIFAGVSTPTVTAPASNPRIDVLTVDSSGTLAWTTGSESASPSAPTYPADKVALCELYNVVSETALYDIENQRSGQGYIYHDVRPFLGERMNWTAFTSDLIPDADGTRNLGSVSFEWNNGYFKTGIFVGGQPIPIGRFGGTGTDGALSVSSGNTNIDCANAAIVVKNYSSISITGTGSVTLINPNANGTVIILKSQGAVTLTSSATPMLNASGMGSAGGIGASVTTSSSGSGNNGNFGLSLLVTNAGAGGQGLTTPGATGALPSLISTSYFSQYLLKYASAWVGSGGGGGGVFSSTNGTPAAVGGTGGTGGGCLIIECAGAWNFTTSGGISVAGAVGGNGTNNNINRGAGGGGGGSGGFFLALYAALTANSGTITISGGTGGNKDSQASSTSAAGGGGGTTGQNVGNAGTLSATPGAQTGGNGGSGFALVASNTEFA